MVHGRFRILAALYVALALMAAGATVYAQGGATSSISGTVVDSSGGIVPGADVTAKNVATGTVFTAVSGGNGAFSIPAIPSGTYSVTVALMGFKTAVLNGVIANVGVPSTVKAVLELGKLEETVVVEAASEVVQTQATSVSSTLSVKQVSNLPLPGRGAFDFVSFMPGVATGGGGSRNATVNGLPQAMVNITLDGMNIQDNFAKSWDGMFTRVSPRLDAVEEITVGSASQDAGSASQGGVQIRFVTRSGTNRYQGSLYYYLQKDALNSNTWFNTHFNVDATGKPTAKPVVANYQPGGRIGGPIVIPGLFDGHDKAFFFVNYEWLSSPGTATRTPTVMTPDSEKGLFRYGTNAVDLLALAARNGQVSTIDPLVAKTLAKMRSSMSQGTLNATTDPATQTLAWQLPTASKTTYPTVRIDYNLTKNNRLSGSYTRNHLVSDPDTTNAYFTDYPGFPVRGTQDSARYSGQGSLRTVLGSSMVNEFRFGATGGATQFFPSLNPDMFSDFGGYGLIFNNFKGIANPYAPASGANSAREATTKVFEDTVNWVKGKHNFNIGGNFTLAEVWLQNQQMVPTVTLGGTVSGDPADAMFSAANFPGASSTDLTAARNLYAILTGRVTAIGRNARIAEDGTTYNVLGESMQKGRLKQTGFHLQDSWRIKPNFTINAGLRYELQMPFYAINNSYSTASLEDLFGVSGTGSNFVPGSTVSGIGNMFTPGAKGGAPTTYELYSKDTPAYKTDRNNLAPSIGAAWTTGAQSGFLRTLLGEQGDSVFRGGWSLAYFRPGMNDFTEIYGSNPGVSIDATRNQTNGNLGTVPLLLSSGNMGAPAINLTRTYPMAVPNASSSVYVFDPNLRTPSSSSFNMGWQRAFGQEHIRRGALHPHEQQGPVDGGQPQPPELQRGQHRRERVPQRVQAGAAEPGGEHRRRQGQHVRLHRARPARRRCRSSWHGSTGRPRPPTRRSTRAAAGRTRRSCSRCTR